MNWIIRGLLKYFYSYILLFLYIFKLRPSTESAKPFNANLQKGNMLQIVIYAGMRYNKMEYNYNYLMIILENNKLIY